MAKIRITRWGYQPKGQARRVLSIKLSREEIALANSARPRYVPLSTWMRQTIVERAVQENAARDKP